MMEYIEYFFGNFWHWLGLVIVLAVAIKPIVDITHIHKNGDDK